MLAVVAQLLSDLTDQIPEGVSERAGEIVEQVRDNPLLMRILLVIGAITAVIFVIGVIKQSVKALLIGGILSAGAWFWYFNIR